MAKSYHQIYIHYIFSTKKRAPMIEPKFEKRLWSYIAGIGAEQGYPVISAGGMADHLHLLVGLSPVVSVSKAIQTIKGSSSKWINDTFFADTRQFKWQEGYSAFSVSPSGLNRTKFYIANQKAHHKTMTFEQEYLKFLKIHNIKYDEKYIWG